MEQPPDFLNSPLEINGEETFQPSIVPRRGGIIAWMATLMIGIVVVILKVKSDQTPCLAIAFFLIFLFAAILITFSYWVDSKTMIRVTRSQLSYQSPFRKFLQTWDQISEINIFRAGNFWRVFIFGDDSFFTIRVGADPISGTNPQKVFELPHGDRLVRIICGMANLSQIHKDGEKWICQRISSSGMMDP